MDITKQTMVRMIIALLIPIMSITGYAQNQVVAWGNNANGQTDVPNGLTNVVAIKAGYHHSLALLRNGTVVAWGSNAYGERAVPADATNVIGLAAGTGHSMALRADGTVVGWGLNGWLRTNTPPDWTNIVAISGSISHYLALRADGTFLGMGDDYQGAANMPAGMSNVIQVAAGGHYSMALKGDGGIFGWGRRFELETNGVIPISKAISVDANAERYMALCADNHAVSGHVLYNEKIAPENFSSDAVGIAAGSSHGLSINNDHTVFASGASPVAALDVPSGLTNVVQVSGGENFSLALIGDGLPFIITPIIQRTINLGSTTWFHVSATGALPLMYQWRLNGTNLLHATNALLSLENLQFSQSGSYSVEVSNKFGLVRSPEAMLTITSNLNSPTLNSFVKSNRLNTFHFSFSTQPGVNYAVEWSDTLRWTNRPSWEIFTNLTGSGYSVPVIDHSATNRFRAYRVRIP
ncbi:MAG: hypothetical protein WCO56_13320 [Verrucomicrobiota bacterium]